MKKQYRNVLQFRTAFFYIKTGCNCLLSSAFERVSGISEKSATSEFVPKVDFDAISGASITTNGFAAIMKEASAAGLGYLESIGGAE